MHEVWPIGRFGAVAVLLGVVAVPASAQVVLYADDNYSGRSFTVFIHQPDLSRVGFNDKASSIIVRSGRWTSAATRMTAAAASPWAQAATAIWRTWA